MTPVKVLVLRENWVGCTGLSAMRAFSRAGCLVDSVTESEFIPYNWRAFAMRVVGRVVRGYAVREYNDAIVRMAHGLRPDLFFAVKGTHVQAKTLRLLKRLGVANYCFFPDVSFTAHGQSLREAIPEYDWVYTTKSFGPKDLLRLFGMTNASFLPHAYDPEVHRPQENDAQVLQRYGCEVSFIGGASEKKVKLLESLLQRRPNLQLRVWGNRWECLSNSSVLRNAAMFRAANGFEYALAISGSKVNLGILSDRVLGASSGDKITSRTFHIPACGGLLLHERTADVLQYFVEGENCVCFEGIDELVAKIDWLLENETTRNSIAAAGRRAVEQAHSWDHRAETILNDYVTRSRGL